MAIFQKTRPHPDAVKKHSITPEELKFLVDLQAELNTQDDMGNADPRFWVIKETEETLGSPERYDGKLLLRDETVMRSLKDVADYVNENYDGDFSAELYGNSLTLYYDDDDGNGRYSIGTWDDFAELLDYVEEQDDDGVWDGFKVVYAVHRDRIVPDTLFLTHADCEEHLRAYGYNYESDAHAFAMTAIRSPRYEKLIRILQTVDFDRMLTDLNETGLPV